MKACRETPCNLKHNRLFQILTYIFLFSEIMFYSFITNSACLSLIQKFFNNKGDFFLFFFPEQYSVYTSLLPENIPTHFFMFYTFSVKKILCLVLNYGIKWKLRIILRQIMYIHTKVHVYKVYLLS